MAIQHLQLLRYLRGRMLVDGIMVTTRTLHVCLATASEQTTSGGYSLQHDMFARTLLIIATISLLHGAYRGT